MDSIFKCNKGCSPEEASLGLWILASSLLVTACLSHTYAAPFLTYEPEMIHPCQLNHSDFKGLDPLQVSLYHTFDPEVSEERNQIHDEEGGPCLNERPEVHHHYHEPFCCMMNLKMYVRNTGLKNLF